MRRRAEPENEWTFVLDILKIAIGVFIGCMASVLVYEQMLVWRGEQAAKQVMQELQKQQERQKLAEQQRLEAQKERDRQKQRAMLEREWEQQQRKLAGLKVKRCVCSTSGLLFKKRSQFLNL